MKHVILLLALALACVCGTAGADTFQVVPGGPAVVPSARVPNSSGGINVPADLEAAPVQPETLSFPELETLWQQAGAAYGIQWQVLAAINKVESNFGQNMGPSSAGAVGWMQFMPSTWLRWGVDADGDGLADPWNPRDAVYAAARYLAASGGQTDIARAVFSYNHAQWYVDEVMQLAHVFGSAGTQATYQIDRLQVSLDGARRAVARANAKLVAARLVDRKLERIEHVWRRRADAAQLLSKQLSLEKTATQWGFREHAQANRVAQLERALRQAEANLEQARTQAQTSSLAPTAQPLLDTPPAAGGYVFPVGGGPSLVSVSHHHHDYPAADIAAPEGSPVYALAQAVVLRSWAVPDPRCGIGLTLRTSDGLTWTYCHLSYLDPKVVRGAVLDTGASVGLVGHTGDATGPHLHLQLDPPTTYPQNMAWFQQFAGAAFRWQDAPTPGESSATAPHPIFAPAAPSAQAAQIVGFTR